MEISTSISLLAVCISFLAYLFSKKSWMETYRPIVTARIETYASGNDAAIFKIVVYNSGNRPAVNIRLITNTDMLEKLFLKSTEDIFKKEILACFSEVGLIPLLHSGGTTNNGFGISGKKESTLVYGASIPIVISYKDLNGRSYKTKQTLLFRDTTYFAGSGWPEKV